MLVFSTRLLKIVNKNCLIVSHSYHGNRSYLARRHRKPKPKNIFSPIESMHQLKRGEKYADRYTDQYGRRSEKFVPRHKLPSPRWHWDYDLTDENANFMKQMVMKQTDSFNKEMETPLMEEEWPVMPWMPGSYRCGAVGIKLGVHPLWFKDGTYANCTLIQIADCHVIKYFSKEEFNGRNAAALVGAKNGSPFYRGEKYHEFCHEAGVPIKAKCFRFYLTENAAIKPGTSLTAMHFRPGQYVDCTAKSVGYGFQGVVQRWHMAGGPKGRNKQWERRLGSIASHKRGYVQKGKKMPGQLGGNNETVRGLKVLRINTRYNVIYVKGRIAGHINQFVQIKDTSLVQYQPTTEEEARTHIGPFPHYLPGSQTDTLPEELYDESVHPLNDSSITFT